MKESKKEEVLSRREFFKSAAKKALPILGAIALTQLPFVAKSHESQITQDCNYGCAGGCSSNCFGSCEGDCNYYCTNSCRGGCTRSCSSLCAKSAY